MKVIVTARHAKFTDGMKDTAWRKAHHLEHYFDHLKKIEVILDVDGERGYRVEMVASGLRDHVLVSHASDRTALSALDSVIGKMERQLKKHKERLNGRRHGRPLKSLPAAEGAGDVWW